MHYQKTIRYFEKTGNVDPAVSYYVTLDNVTNTDNLPLQTMVEQGRYFTIFAPRQSGKTTFFENFCQELEKDLQYIAIQLSFQEYKSLAPERFYNLIQNSLFEQLIKRIEPSDSQELESIRHVLGSYPIKDHITFRTFFENMMPRLPQKRFILFIDEFDGIPSEELEPFLTAIRELYQKYKKSSKKALHSVGLVGIRNITKLIVGGVSPFNIADQVKLPRFSLANVRDLYAQYTAETNQPFTEEAVRKVYEETAGQPWLVNRLGSMLTIHIKPETTDPITPQDVDAAIALLLKERNSHFDNLIEKARQYKETFVSIVFNGVEYNPDDEDQSWLEQYGLIREEQDKAQVLNPIYQRRFVRAFFRETEAVTDPALQSYYTLDGALDMEAILTDFEEYMVQIGINAFYERQKPYEKTGKYLLTAWLYQFVQGGKGELRYETPTGPGIMDILLTYQGRKYIIETKLNRWKLQTTLQKACQQVARKYLIPERANEGYLVIFDLKTTVGDHLEPQRYQLEGKKITSIVIGIGKP